jgi:hypothetical protein
MEDTMDKRIVEIPFRELPEDKPEKKKKPLPEIYDAGSGDPKTLKQELPPPELIGLGELPSSGLDLYL